MIKIIQLLLLILSTLILKGCGTYSKATTLDPNTNYFPSKEYQQKRVIVLKDIPVSADTLKSLIVISDETYWLSMAKNLNYFNEVVTSEQLHNTILEQGISTDIINIKKGIGLDTAYTLYKPYVALGLDKFKNDHGKWYAWMYIYDPKRKETIYECSIPLDLMWDGWTDQGTVFPLFNSLLDYLRKQK